MILQIIFLPLIFSLISYMVKKKFTRVLTGAVQVYVLGSCFYLFLQAKTEPIRVMTGSRGDLGIELVFSSLSGLFVLLTAFICTVVILYAMTKEATQKLFVFLLFSVQSLMFLSLLSVDLFNIYLALEISLLICTMLITYKREQRKLYDGLVYLLTNIVGMLFFLMGIGYLYKVFGSTSLIVIGEQMATVAPKSVVLPFAFLMTGACLKCAFMPMFFWLPKAHGTPGAPSVVSAILSGVFVKCGIFLFIRLRALFYPAIELDLFFLIIGSITGIGGILFALCQINLKKILAYHTVSQMGLILIGIALNNTYAMSGALLHVMNHALFKSLLFLCAGMIINVYGTKNILEIHGVMKRMPVVGIALLAGILGITGAPFFNGSISKYFIQSGAHAGWIECMIILINIGTCLSFSKVAYMLLGTHEEADKETEHITFFTTAALLILAVGCFITGVAGMQLMDFFLGYALPVKLGSYIQKSLLWLGMIGGCSAFYVYKMKKMSFFKKEHSLDLSFNYISLCTVSFFGMLLLCSLLKL